MMATLEEIQREELKILKHFDNVCRKNNVNYSMFAGTMLGAIRHKGFIPWDDDVDVFMRIKDFKKIEKQLSNDDFFLQTPKNDPEMPFMMYKIRKNNTFMPEPGLETLTNIHQGIWIDVQVCTNAAKTKIGKRIQNFFSCMFETYRHRYLYRNTDVSRKFHIFLTKLPNSIQILIDKLIINCIILFGNKKSSELFLLNPGRIGKLIPREFLENTDYYSFEDSEFLGPKDYNKFLIFAYGPDYMTPKKWGHLPDYSKVIIDE